MVGADAVPKKLGSNELQWNYVFTGNNGTTTYAQKFENLDKNKTYYFLVLIPICYSMQVATSTYVTNCNGIYEKLPLTGTYSNMFSLYKVENTALFEVKTVLTVTNGGVMNFYCAFD